MKRRKMLMIAAMVGSGGCLRLQENEGVPGQSTSDGPTADGSTADPASDGKSGGAPAPEVTLSEHWTADANVDFVWTVAGKFYFTGYNTAASAIHGDGMLWDDEVVYGEATTNLGGDAFAKAGRYAVFGYTPDVDGVGCHFHAYDDATGEEVWSFGAPGVEGYTQASGVTVVDDVAVVAGNNTLPADETLLWGLDLETGEVRWQGDESLPNGFAVNYVGTHDGSLYVATRSGGTHVLDPDAGDLLDTHESTHVAMMWGSSGGRIHGDTLFTYTGTEVRAFPLAEGGVEWSTDEVDGVSFGPTVDNSLVAIGTEAGDVLVYDRTSGELQWDASIDGTVKAVELTALRAWVADRGTGLTAYDRGDGTRLHQSTQPLGGSDIAVSDDVILFGGDGVRAYAIEEA